MNIGIVTQWFPCGAGHVSQRYAEVLGQADHVFIYARGGRRMYGDPFWDGPRVTWAPPHPASTGIRGRHFTQWALRNRIEAVLFNEQRHWAGVLLARKLGLLVGGYVDYYTQETVPLFRLYDFLICNTRRHYSVFRSHPQCLYCPWGTRTDSYRPVGQHPERPVTFLISAGWDGAYARAQPWMDRRGTGLAMWALRRVEGSCRLIVYSQVRLQQCPSDWQAAVGADPRIDFRTGTFEPFPYYEGDVYVYPSRLDGIGLTVPEALSSGLPVITTDSAPMNEFVRHGTNGLLVPVKEYRGRPDGYYWPESLCDEESLNQAMREYLCDPQKVQSHAAHARALAEQELNWENNASGLGAWITQQKRLPVDPTQLPVDSARYDQRTGPTPLQQVALGCHAFYRLVGSASSR